MSAGDQNIETLLNSLGETSAEARTILRESVEQVSELEKEYRTKFREIAPQRVTAAVRTEARGTLLTFVQSQWLSLGELQNIFGTLSQSSRGLVRKILNWILTHFIGAISTYAAHLSIDSWSVGATGGFPWGINFSITITFK